MTSAPAARRSSTSRTGVGVQRDLARMRGAGPLRPSGGGPTPRAGRPGCRSRRARTPRPRASRSRPPGARGAHAGVAHADGPVVVEEDRGGLGIHEGHRPMVRHGRPRGVPNGAQCATGSGGARGDRSQTVPASARGWREARSPRRRRSRPVARCSRSGTTRDHDAPGRRVRRTDRDRRHRDDGEPLLRPLARLARRGPRVRGPRQVQVRPVLRHRREQPGHLPGPEGPRVDPPHGRVGLPLEPLPRMRPVRPEPRLDRGAGAAGSRLRRPERERRPPAARLLRGGRPPLHGAVRQAVHDLRRLPRVDPRAHLPEPRVPALRAVRREQDERVLPGPDGFEWPTIWDKLAAANVPAKYYASDLPVLPSTGTRMLPYNHTLADFYTECANGTLPNVVMVDPAFIGAGQNDDHPLADVRGGTGVPPRRVQGVRAVTAVGARALHLDLRRVGRVLRPRAAAALRRRPGERASTRTTSPRPGSASRP